MNATERIASYTCLNWFRFLRRLPARNVAPVILACLLGTITPSLCGQQSPPPSPGQGGSTAGSFDPQTVDDYNKRLRQLYSLELPLSATASEYRIGPEDLLEITVFDAPELNRTLRVSAGGEVSLPLLGPVQAAGLTPRELEMVLEELLRRAFMKDPHVGVHVSEMQSHPVSVVGAVKKPGVFQVRGPRSLLEVLSLAEGLAEDAGDSVVVMRGAARVPVVLSDAATNAAEASGSGDGGGVEINLKRLLESGEARYNIPVYPGDIVKVPRAGIVYVLGEVRKPGGFLLKTNESISVLQALALGEGLTRTASQGNARIIRTDEETGQRTEIRIDLGRIFKGKAADPVLEPRDIVFVPNSSARRVLYRGTEIGLATLSGVVIFRR